MKGVSEGIDTVELRPFHQNISTHTAICWSQQSGDCAVRMGSSGVSVRLISHGKGEINKVL